MAHSVSRRALLRGTMLGAGAFAVPAALAGCGDNKSGSGGSSSTNKNVTFGSNYSDEVPKKAIGDTIAKFDSSKGYTTKINTVDHNSFQENITRYLQGNPDDAFTWFAGFRMRYFAAQGLATPIDDVWQTIGANYSDAFKKASTGDDGKMYFVPFYNYPWALFYRKSVWQAKGYEVPKTIDELKTLRRQDEDRRVVADRLRRQGRLAGHGHLRPAQHAAQRLRLPPRADGAQAVLDRTRRSRRSSTCGRGCCPSTSPAPTAAPGRRPPRTWAPRRAACTCWAASWPSSSRAPTWTTSTSSRSPRWTRTIGTGAVEAPIDGFMISKKAKNVAGAKELLKFLGTAEAQNIYLKSDPSDVGANNQADSSGYNALQKKACRVHRRRPSRSPSSWTGTRTRRSPRPS